MLGAARTERRLSVADVSNRLLLSTAQVYGLERGDPVAFYGPAFFVDAARRYAALVDAPLPQQDLLVTPELLPTTNPPARLPLAAVLSSFRRQDWLGGAALISATAAVLMLSAGFFWYFGASPTEPPRQMVSEPPPHASPEEPVPPKPSVPLQPPAIASASEPAEPERPAGAEVPEIDRLIVSRPSWVFVRFKDGQVLEQTIWTEGSIPLITVPHYLAAGALQKDAGVDVTLILNGREVSLSPFINGNEVRIGAAQLAELATTP